MKRQALLFLILLCLAALSACGGESTVGQITGTWYPAGSETPAFTLDPSAPADIPRAVQTGGQLTIPADGGETRTAEILSREDGRLTLGFAGAGMLVFQNAPAGEPPVPEEGERAE